eukprot:scaffold4451_cov172-Ochromonas_danica.AAC.1
MLSLTFIPSISPQRHCALTLPPVLSPSLSPHPTHSHAVTLPHSALQRALSPCSTAPTSRMRSVGMTLDSRRIDL